MPPTPPMASSVRRISSDAYAVDESASLANTASAVGLHGVWINGTHVTDAKGFCADPKSRPGEVLRSFAA